MTLYLLLFAGVAAATFSFTSTPTLTQCDPVQVNWTGGSGTGYRLHVLPTFGIPLNISIPDSAYTNGQGTFSTTLVANRSEQMVLTMSDSSGFGAGGTTPLFTVGASLGGNCDLTAQKLGFTYGLDPTPSQCGESVFSNYLETHAVAPVSIFGVIPGGSSLQLSPGSADTFDWKVNIFNGTNVIILMTDANGNSGGSELFNIGLSGDTSCITQNSPSTTTASSSASTGTSSASSSATAASSSSGSNIGAIAGSVLGALIFLAVLVTLGLFFLQQWQKKKRGAAGGRSDFRRSVRPMDSELDLAASGTPISAFHDASPHPPAHYRPHSDYLSQTGSERANPFDSTVSLHAASSTHHLSTVDPFLDQTTGSPTSSSQRKSGMSSYRPARYIVHTDAEDEEIPPNEDGVVELPPSYSARRNLPPP